MSGFPDSHLASSVTSSGRGRFRAWTLAAAPLIALAAWFVYLWAVSGVIPSVERYPNGRVKAEGYVKRVGFGAYKRHGHWTTYYPSGARQSEGTYVLGEKQTDWVYWAEDDGDVHHAEPPGISSSSVVPPTSH